MKSSPVGAATRGRERERGGGGRTAGWIQVSTIPEDKGLLRGLGE